MLVYTVICDMPFLAFLFFFASGVWFLLLASVSGCPRVVKHLRGREWAFSRTMLVLALILFPILLLQILFPISMLIFFAWPAIAGFVAGWKARSYWIAVYASLVAVLVSATVMVLYFAVEPDIPTYSDYMAILGLYTLVFLIGIAPSLGLGFVFGHWQRTPRQKPETRKPPMGFRNGINESVAGPFRPTPDDREALGMEGAIRDRGRVSAGNAVLLAGLTAAIVGGFMHDPSPPVGRFEESLVWQWVSIGGAEIALLGAGLRVRLSPVVGAGKALLVGGLVAAWFAALVFDPDPSLSWANVIPLVVFVLGSVYAILHTLVANYII